MSEEAASIPDNGKGTKVGVGIHNLSVALRFDKATQMVTFTHEQAHQLGRQLIKTGKRVARQISQRKRELARKAAER